MEIRVGQRRARACVFISISRPRPAAISDGHVGPKRAVLQERGETFFVIHLTDGVDLRPAQIERTPTVTTNRAKNGRGATLKGEKKRRMNEWAMCTKSNGKAASSSATHFFSIFLFVRIAWCQRGVRSLRDRHRGPMGALLTKTRNPNAMARVLRTW